MTTKGFDEPSVEGVILNRLTKSLVLYNQMCGRAVRPYQYPDGHYKEYGLILDMCDNVIGGGHGQWSDPIDWEYLFLNPKMPKQGVAPSKTCPECNACCAASARYCRGLIQDPFGGDMIECGYEFPQKEQTYDDVEREMVLISKDINVEKIINFPKFQNKSEYYTFFETVRACAYFASQRMTVMDKDEFEHLWEITHRKIVEWQTITGRAKGGRKRQDTEWYTRKGRESLLKFLRDDYKCIVNLVENEELKGI
jgi:hypothetical protein